MADFHCGRFGCLCGYYDCRNLALDVQIALPMVLIGAAAGCLVGFVLEFFLFGADYTRTEYLEYDDDDYYTT